jgi:hypothetical protein
VKPRFLVLFSVFLLAALSVHAQDDFGFGFGEEEPDAASGNGAVSPSRGGITVGGEAQAELFFYAKEFESGDAFRNIRPGNVFAGKLNFAARGSNADGVINLKIRPNFEDPARILSLDEAYVSAFLGNFTIEGGVRKLTWGKADSLGPLDVVNPLDYSDLSAMSDIQSIKIARPLVRASYSIGGYTRIEGVFVPWFEGHRFAQSPDDRWTALQVKQVSRLMSGRMESEFIPLVAALAGKGVTINQQAFGFDPNISADTSTLRYAQGGLRFTTTVGSSDIGAQYYSGMLPRPAALLNFQTVEALKNQLLLLDNMTPVPPTVSATPTPADLQAQIDWLKKIAEIQALVDSGMGGVSTASLINIAYTRYHQIGVDYARVIGGFNLRGELAANITKDFSGDDGLVYNPSLAWSLGFDRDLFAGINLNLQVNENIRLFNSKIGSSPLTDIEADTNVTGTRLTLVLSRKFFRDELELRATGIWGIEDMDCYILPALIWTKRDITMEFSGGIFAGDRQGELGQYYNNGFFKTLLTYSF